MLTARLQIVLEAESGPGLGAGYANAALLTRRARVPRASDTPASKLIRRTIAQHVLVCDDQIRHAMRTLLESAKVLVEPSGDCARRRAERPRRKAEDPGANGPLVVIVSGGNICTRRLKELL